MLWNSFVLSIQASKYGGCSIKQKWLVNNLLVTLKWYFICYMRELCMPLLYYIWKEELSCFFLCTSIKKYLLLYWIFWLISKWLMDKIFCNTFSDDWGDFGETDIQKSKWDIIQFLERSEGGVMADISRYKKTLVKCDSFGHLHQVWPLKFRMSSYIYI